MYLSVAFGALHIIFFLARTNVSALVAVEAMAPAAIASVSAFFGFVSGVFL